MAGALPGSTARNRKTKQQLLEGSHGVHWEFFEELDAEIPLRSLAEGQAAHVESIRTDVMRISGEPQFGEKGEFTGIGSMDVQFTIAGITQADHEADVQAVAYAMADGDEWTTADVEALRPIGIVEKIAKVVYELSGMTKTAEEAVRSFREHAGGAADGGAPPDHGPAGADPAPDDPAPATVPGDGGSATAPGPAGG